MTSINELEDDLSQLNIDEGNNTATQRQRQARAHQTVEEHIQYNVNNAVQQREHRTRMTEEEHRQYNNANDAAQHRDRQAGMTEEEHRQNNENRRLRDTERQAGMTEEEHHQYNVNRRLRDTEHRTQMTEEEHQQYNERRRRRRYEYATYRACNCNIDTFNPNTSYIIPNDLGPMTHQCDYCGALGFKCEMKRNEGITHMGKMCCNQGQIDLPPPPPAPIKLYALFTEGTPEAKMFRHLIRYFNSGMAMGSLQADDATLYQGGPAAFKLHGQLYKRIGPMLPARPSVWGDGTPKCLQIYFCDAEEQANIRVRQDCGVRRNRTTYEKHKAMFKLLHNILTTCGNPHLRKYLSIHEEITSTGMNPDDIQIVIETHPDDARHSGRFGAPVSTEIFALLPDRTNEHVSKYAIITPMRQSDPTNNPIRRIPDHYKIHDPLLYPLLRPTGEEGWHRELRFRSRKISAREYTRFRMMKRILSNIDPLDPNETVQMHDISHLACKLWQQWLCDAWAKVESNDLGWVENHQDEIYADKYVNVKKRAAQNTTGGGKPTVLPATYTGSDRYMYKKFQDAMALCRVFGRPHLFITFTMDVFCKEVTDQLMPGQNPYDRPDIIARVYWQKYKAFISEIAKDGIFGKCIARCSTVEFQKRGAPHTHTLLWIENFDNSTANLDNIISAEIPPRGEEGILQRELYDLVTSKMIHGPCSHGWSCWKNDCCSKYFPYAFSDETIIGDDYYPQYRRRSPENGGNTARMSNGKEVDNRWVVPYNAYLLLKYRSHINVQYVVSIASIKYLFKYNHKGHDLLTVPRSSSSPPIQTVPPATAVAKITPAKTSSPKYSNSFDDEDASFGLGKGILPNTCDDMPVLKQRSFRCDPPTKSTASEAVFEDKKPSAQDIIPPETGTVDLSNHPTKRSLEQPQLSSPGNKRVKKSTNQTKATIARLDSQPITVYEVKDTSNDGKIKVHMYALAGGQFVLTEFMMDAIRHAFYYPVMHQLKTNPENTTMITCIVHMCNKCIPDHPESVQNANPLGTSFYPARTFLIPLHEGETIDVCQKDTTDRMTVFTAQNVGDADGKYKYAPEYCTGTLVKKELPWNTYIQNRSICAFLKRYYSHNTRHDIMTHDDVLIRFFGSVEEGKKQLTMSDTKWSIL